MASRYGARITSLTLKEGAAPPAAAPNGVASYERNGSVGNGSRSSSVSSYDSSSELVKPKYERQLLSEYGRIKSRASSSASTTTGYSSRAPSLGGSFSSRDPSRNRDWDDAPPPPPPASTHPSAKSRDFDEDDGFVIKPPPAVASATSNGARERAKSRDLDDEVFVEPPAPVVVPVVVPTARQSKPWSTYKPPASASARALARSVAPSTPAAAPSRIQWDYRKGGVLVQEVDEGQPCLSCHEKCPGFTPHMWRKTCNSCKCPREAHDVYHEEWVNVRERLGFEPVTSPGQPGQPAGGRERSRAEGYSWVPPGLPSHKIEEYFSQLPAGKVPRLSSPGEKYRDRQLVQQLPKQDLALAYCKHVEAQHHSSYEDFISARNEIALDIGYVADASAYTECPQCRQTVAPGEVVVIAPKLGARTAWHPACFACCSCQELLVDLTYCVHDDQIYCERHYAEQLKPRCAACDELIFSGEYTKAMSKDWHSGHFCCWQCDESLTGQRYVLRDDHPYCIKCYESVFANVCEECNRTIGIDSKDLSYKDKHWHEACFLCSKCRVSLVDKQFGSKADKIYCGNCYDAQFASRCDGCGEIFRAGTKKMEYKTRQWHEKCFCCCVCKSAIGTKSFIPREQEIYCAGCYEEKFATRCVKCNKIITSGGVTYKNEPWHRECFTCTNCNTSLAGQRFTSRDEKPYCAECFGELFAKRCTSCSKPITGIGGTRFISFEDRHWHNDCFICASCKTSLVGRGFITDADDIICPECAKQKLM